MCSIFYYYCSRVLMHAQIIDETKKLRCSNKRMRYFVYSWLWSDDANRVDIKFNEWNVCETHSRVEYVCGGNARRLGHDLKSLLKIMKVNQESEPLEDTSVLDVRSKNSSRRTTQGSYDTVVLFGCQGEQQMWWWWSRLF